MNRRINELVDRAKKNAHHRQLVYPEFLEEFAELIINECIDQCDKHDPHPDQWSDPGEYTERRTVRNCIKSIKEHFGVEE